VTVSRVSDVKGQPAGYLAISRDITEAEVARQALQISSDELRHRLRNTYAMIGSLIQGFARGNAERSEFAREIQSRLIALSAAQSLFATTDAPCDVAALIPALVEAFSTEKCAVTMAAFPDATLQQGQADALALALGELAVNSAKHGAINHGGAINIRAEQTASRLSILWEETSDAPVLAQERTGGQGLRLIDRIMRARDGTVAIDWHAQGLTVSLAFNAVSPPR
jgi:two-component sensor histidine kinase